MQFNKNNLIKLSKMFFNVHNYFLDACCKILSLKHN